MGCLDGKVAIVTGSGQGIGRGIAIGLAREGAKVVTNNRKPKGESVSRYDKNSMPKEEWDEMLRLSGDAEATAAIINDEGGAALPFYGDVSDFEVAKEFIDFTVKEFGGVDILVNNAAGLGSGSITSLTEGQWERMTQAKMKGAFNMMHFAVPLMVEKKFGRVLNCASEAWTGLVDNDAYSAANAGVVGLTWAAAKELYRFGITVNAYCPQGASPAHTVEYNKMLRNVKAMTGKDADPALLKDVENDHGDPVNLGPIMSYLCSDDAAYISGEVFAVKSSGKISRFSLPEEISRAERPRGAGPLWSVSELKEVFRRDVMGKGYESAAAKSVWDKRRK